MNDTQLRYERDALQEQVRIQTARVNRLMQEAMASSGSSSLQLDGKDIYAWRSSALSWEQNARSVGKAADEVRRREAVRAYPEAYGYSRVW